MDKKKATCLQAAYFHHLLSFTLRAYLFLKDEIGEDPLHCVEGHTVRVLALSEAVTDWSDLKKMSFGKTARIHSGKDGRDYLGEIAFEGSHKSSPVSSADYCQVVAFQNLPRVTGCITDLTRHQFLL